MLLLYSISKLGNY